MPFDPERYTHESDRAALKALQAIPGFSLLTKGFMSLWNEPQGRILNMSTRIKLGEDQMKKYYDMLPPVCESVAPSATVIGALKMGAPLLQEMVLSPDSAMRGAVPWVASAP